MVSATPVNRGGGNSCPSFRSPNGRGMILNINQCRSESCRKHDVRQKVTRKRTNTHEYGGIADHARNKAKTRTSVRKNHFFDVFFFLNQMLFRVCSRSSVESEPPVSTRLVVGSNPTGSTLEDWRSGRTHLFRKQENRKVPGVRISHPPRNRWQFLAVLSRLSRCALNRKHRHGWWAVRQRRSPAKTVGVKVPGEFDSRTIRLPICSDRPRDRAFGIQSAKRVDRQWRNAVGHTCPAHSRTFPHGVTAAHGSLEPLVLVRNQVRERFRRLLQTDWKRPAKPWERVRLPYSPLSGSNIRFDFFLYTRHDMLYRTYRESGVTQAAKTTPRPCSSVDRASVSGTEGHESDSR